MQGHPTIFVLPLEAVSSGCCNIVESLQVPLPDGKDQRIIVPGKRKPKKKKRLTNIVTF